MMCITDRRYAKRYRAGEALCIVSFNVDSVQTDEEVVVGTHVAGSSTTNCRMKSTRRGNRTSFGEKCNCSGYSYLYNNQTARCAGHPGNCRTQPNSFFLFRLNSFTLVTFIAFTLTAYIGTVQSSTLLDSVA